MIDPATVTTSSTQFAPEQREALQRACVICIAALAEHIVGQSDLDCISAAQAIITKPSVLPDLESPAGWKALASSILGAGASYVDVTVH